MLGCIKVQAYQQLHTEGNLHERSIHTFVNYPFYL